MRILGFSKMWPKLNQELLFTTFRYPRRDKDWEVEELVQVVFQPRRKGGGEKLGIARIIRKQDKDTRKEWTYYPRPDRPNTLDMISPEDANEDGFTGMHGGGDIAKLRKWLRESAGWERFHHEPIVHQLTLYWIEKYAEED